MSIFSDESKRAENRWRKQMIFWLVFILGVCVVAVAALIFQITQPIIFHNQKRQTQISVDAEKLKFHVEKISKEFFPRSASHVENLDKTAAYIKQEFDRAGGKTLEQAFVVEGKTYRNVIALFGAESDERIVIGAHYDAAGALPAADDNASGVAGLIELAYLLGQTRLSAQVELVAFTLEEPPYFGSANMGSFRHAESLHRNNIQLRLMISLEMIGYFSDEPNSQSFPVSILSLFYPSRGNFIAVVGSFGDSKSARRVKAAMSRASDLPVYSLNAPPFNGLDFSDHRNYWGFGYSAVMVTDTAFYRNKNYHTAADTAEKLDYNRMAKVVAGVYNFVVETAK